jgi:acyl-CoA reductase-like NAD-dependent aldehyde dehydrogenase
MEHSEQNGTRLLPSWTQGRWWDSGAAGTEVVDAVTGEPVARVASDGLDAAGAVAYAREIGGAGLRRSGFVERAGMVKELAKALGARREELVELSARTGATAADASVDVDGGIGTALVCGSLGDLLDHLGGQDLVSFTGSADTAALLRSNDADTRRSVRFNAEADSLNGSVLGPDAVPGTPEFELFADQLVHGGPGRAGGGEEGGGLRAVTHHLQRTAVQAGPRVLDVPAEGCA